MIGLPASPAPRNKPGYRFRRVTHFCEYIDHLCPIAEEENPPSPGIIVWNIKPARTVYIYHHIGLYGFQANFERDKIPLKLKI